MPGACGGKRPLGVSQGRMPKIASSPTVTLQPPPETPLPLGWAASTADALERGCWLPAGPITSRAIFSRGDLYYKRAAAARQRRPRVEEASGHGEEGASGAVPLPPESRARMTPEEDGARAPGSVRIRVEGQLFSVEKAVLVESSEYFRALFRSGMKESTQEEIVLGELSAAGFLAMLRVLAGERPVLGGEETFQAVECAAFLQAKPLAKYLINTINSDNCILLYQAAAIFGLLDLFHRAALYIRDSYAELEDYLDCLSADLLAYVEALLPSSFVAVGAHTPTFRVPGGPLQDHLLPGRGGQHVADPLLPAAERQHVPSRHGHHGQQDLHRGGRLRGQQAGGGEQLLLRRRHQRLERVPQPAPAALRRAAGGPRGLPLRHRRRVREDLAEIRGALRGVLQHLDLRLRPAAAQLGRALRPSPGADLRLPVEAAGHHRHLRVREPAGRLAPRHRAEAAAELRALHGGPPRQPLRHAQRPLGRLLALRHRLLQPDLAAVDGSARPVPEQQRSPLHRPHQGRHGLHGQQDADAPLLGGRGDLEVQEGAGGFPPQRLPADLPPAPAAARPRQSPRRRPPAHLGMLPSHLAAPLGSSPPLQSCARVHGGGALDLEVTLVPARGEGACRMSQQPCAKSHQM
uniref:BTB domain-containing protein n=1 Tax=Anas platyrhynchos TaxID=8839 RepID=A0A8B9TES8_ANAPL